MTTKQITDILEAHKLMHLTHVVLEFSLYSNRWFTFQGVDKTTGDRVIAKYKISKKKKRNFVYFPGDIKKLLLADWDVVEIFSETKTHVFEREKKIKKNK